MLEIQIDAENAKYGIIALLWIVGLLSTLLVSCIICVVQGISKLEE